MEFSYKKARVISICYVLIVVAINFLSVLLPMNVSHPLVQHSLMKNWTNFLKEYENIINLITVFTFGLPVLLCFLYTFRINKNNFKTYFINLPIILSSIGILGWITNFISEIFFIFYAQSVISIPCGLITITSFIYIFQEALFTFTVSYLVLNSLHNKIFFPRFFPEGNLTKIKGIIKPSLKILFFVFYVSIGLFPLFYLISSHIFIMLNNNIPIDKNFIVLVTFLLFVGIFILVIFTRYFSSPVKKLMAGTKRIKEGNLSEKIDIISSDSFGELSDTFNEMISSLNIKNEKIAAIQNSIIKGMAVMVESRDNSTGGHINRTSDCVKVFIEKLCKSEQFSHLSEEFCNAVIKAAPMHDLGKIAIDDVILRKPGKFTDEEYEIMKKHSAEGARIVESVLNEVDDINFKRIAINIAHYHHEKWNGTGYPERISGEQIPMEARIMALADVFDALVSKRCYKDSFSYDKAFQIIEESLGSHFDPELGKIFIQCRPELQKLYESY